MILFLKKNLYYIYQNLDSLEVHWIELMKQLTYS